MGNKSTKPISNIKLSFEEEDEPKTRVFGGDRIEIKTPRLLSSPPPLIREEECVSDFNRLLFDQLCKDWVVGQPMTALLQSSRGVDRYECVFKGAIDRTSSERAINMQVVSPQTQSDTVKLVWSEHRGGFYYSVMSTSSSTKSNEVPVFVPELIDLRDRLLSIGTFPAKLHEEFKSRVTQLETKFLNWSDNYQKSSGVEIVVHTDVDTLTTAAGAGEVVEWSSYNFESIDQVDEWLANLNTGGCTKMDVWIKVKLNYFAWLVADIYVNKISVAPSVTERMGLASPTATSVAKATTATEVTGATIVVAIPIESKSSPSKRPASAISTVIKTRSSSKDTRKKRAKKQ